MKIIIKARLVARFSPHDVMIYELLFDVSMGEWVHDVTLNTLSCFIWYITSRPSRAQDGIRIWKPFQRIYRVVGTVTLNSKEAPR